MKTFDGIGPAAKEIRDWLRANGKSLPAAARQAVSDFSAVGSSDVGLVATFAEAIFEHRDAAPQDARELGAAAARFGARHHYHGLNVGRRGYRMANELDGGRAAPTALPNA